MSSTHPSPTASEYARLSDATETDTPPTKATRKPSKPRHRASIACAGCRDRRIRCVVPKGENECSQCKRAKVECIIKNDDERRRPISRAYVRWLSDRVALLEGMLEEHGIELPSKSPPKSRYGHHLEGDTSSQQMIAVSSPQNATSVTHEQICLSPNDQSNIVTIAVDDDYTLPDAPITPIHDIETAKSSHVIPPTIDDDILNELLLPPDPLLMPDIPNESYDSLISPNGTIMPSPHHSPIMSSHIDNKHTTHAVHKRQKPSQSFSSLEKRTSLSEVAPPPNASSTSSHSPVNADYLDSFLLAFARGEAPPNLPCHTPSRPAASQPDFVTAFLESLNSNAIYPSGTQPSGIKAAQYSELIRISNGTGIPSPPMDATDVQLSNAQSDPLSFSGGEWKNWSMASSGVGSRGTVSANRLIKGPNLAQGFGYVGSGHKMRRGTQTCLLR